MNKLDKVINTVNNHPDRFDTESKKAMFVFGQLVESIRTSLPSKDERLQLHKVETPFAIDKVNVEKAYQKLYTYIYDINVSRELELDDCFEYVASKNIDFKDYEELQFCYTLGLTINVDSLSGVYTFAEAAELYGISDGSVLRNAQIDGRFLEGETRKSGKVWLVTKTAMERLYGEKKN